jgi:hypothetical protein
MSPVSQLIGGGKRAGKFSKPQSRWLRISMAVLALIAASLACTRRATSPIQQQATTTPPVRATQPLGIVPTQEPQVVPTPTPFTVFLPFFPLEFAPAKEGGAPAEQATPLPVDPRVEVTASGTTLKVGDLVTIKGVAVDIGLPYYYLVVRDDGVQDMPPLVMVTFENILTVQDGSSQVVEFVSAEGNNNEVTFELRAKAAGVTTVSINATGEIHTAAGVTWNGGGSGSVVITVVP